MTTTGGAGPAARRYDAIAIGEYLIDFLPQGVSASGEPLLERNPGGAPVNVMAALAKLGKRTGLIGKVGDDPFGRYLAEVLERQGIDGAGLRFANGAHTTMAFVHLDEAGERSFHFARRPGADELLREDEVDPAMTRNAAICHFGSVSLTSEPARTATLSAVRQARGAGALVSYDPNWRPALWPDEGGAREVALRGIELADVLKVSEEELVFLSGCADREAGASLLLERYAQLRIVLVTLGAEGTYFRTASAGGTVPSCRVETVDTTGAGDGFMGAFLCRVLESGDRDVRHWGEAEARDAIAFANAAGALATTRKGAMSALATREEIASLLDAQRSS